METIVFPFIVMDGHQKTKKCTRLHESSGIFIYSLVTLFRSVLYLKEAMVKLQSIHEDIVSGVVTVMECCNELKK